MDVSMRPASVHAHLDIVWQHVKVAYDAQNVPHQVRLPKLSWSMICASEALNTPVYPEMSGCKAAQIRHLVSPLRSVVENHFNSDGRHGHLQQMLVHLERFYAIIDSYSFGPVAGANAQNGGTTRGPDAHYFPCTLRQISLLRY
jgi:hypothetical protein